MTAITVCPHCGFESEDEELCRACGQVMEDKAPVRKVSLTYLLGNNLFSWFKDKGFYGLEHDDELLKEDPIIDPEFSLLTGNIYNNNEE